MSRRGMQRTDETYSDRWRRAGPAAVAKPATGMQAASSRAATAARLLSVFKLRIGCSIALCALAGMAATPGPFPDAWRMAAVAVAVLGSSAAAGAFNQYFERDLDRRMARTRDRPFASGAFSAGWHWPLAMFGLLWLSVAAAAASTNALAATHVFLGAFTYGFAYTVWLKRRTWLNIVVGGLAGSFAVLAGAAAVDPAIAPAAWWLAAVLFLWTPPHFWSLALAQREQYASAGVPMLPVLTGPRRAARVILAHAVALVALSLVPFWFGMGAIYLVGAATGGARFLWTSIRLVQTPTRAAAYTNFHASLVQLALLLAAAILDGLQGHPGAGG